MIKRSISSCFSELFKYYPLVSLTGPRQSGKTTLLRNLYPERPYYSLEDPDQRNFALRDPRGFLSLYPQGGIIDEIQQVPELFSYLQTSADLHPHIQFILSGSQNFLMMEKITQSLAGRVGLLSLLPLSLEENSIPASEEWIWYGGYPALFDKHIPPPIFFPNYLRTYLERDVRTLVNVGNILDFERFIRLCAGRTGQILNISSLASDTGISVNTAKSWLSILQTSFTIFLLPPYFNNFNKRVIKMPKLYFWDTGLVSWLLGISSSEQLSTHYSIGSLFENAIIVEFAKQFYHRGKIPNFFYFRDSNGREIDLIIDHGPKTSAIEIKYSKTIQTEYFRTLQYWNATSQFPASQNYLIYGGSIQSDSKDAHIVPWNQLPLFN